MTPSILSRPFPGPFRFRDLPGEIRNKIYRILLCDIDPPSPELDGIGYLAAVEHDIDPYILETSKEIYREAYDVMVKTNRFVKVTTSAGIPLRRALSGLRVPIVTDIERMVNGFKGYVMGLHLGLEEEPKIDRLSPSYNPDLERFTVMILHRDLGKFCKGIIDLDAGTPDINKSGFTRSLKICIEMAPVLDALRDSSISPSFEDFFSQSMQETLVAPLRANLRGHKGVEVKGHIDRSLAVALCNDLEKDRYSDPEAVLAQFAAAKEEGARLFRERQLVPAWLKWQDASIEIDFMLGSTSWPNLVLRGKQNFVSQIANIYFLMRLNSIQVQLSQWEDDPFISSTFALDGINYAYRSLKRGYWMKGFKHTASPQHMAKLYFRHATFLRLDGDPETIDQACRLIERALQMQPGDPGVLREKERIRQWMRDVS